MQATTTIRLRLAEGGMRAARRHPLIESLRPDGAPPRAAEQEFALVDSAEGALRRAGWLCLGVTDAPELQPLPDAAAMPDVEALGPLKMLAQGRRQIARDTLMLDGMTVTADFAALELGQGRHRAAWEEVAFTLPAAGAASGLDLALSLSRDLPLAWCGAPPLADAARRLGLLAAKPRRANDVPFAIPPQASAAGALAAILRHCLAQLDANVQAVLADADIEGVHQMRVALRRIRSALAIFAPILPEPALTRLVKEIRWLNGPLGRKRDLDVFITETLDPLRQAMPSLGGLDDLATVLAARRDAAQRALGIALSAPRFAQLRLRLGALAERPEPALLAWLGPAVQEQAAAPAAAFAAQVLRRRRRKLKKRAARLDHHNSEALHDLRIRAKKLRYAAEFFRPLFGGKATRRLTDALALLQDSLGALNDAAVGATLVHNALGLESEDPVAAAITAWFAGRQALQLAHLDDAWEAVAAVKPYWKDALAEAAAPEEETA